MLINFFRPEKAFYLDIKRYLKVCIEILEVLRLDKVALNFEKKL